MGQKQRTRATLSKSTGESPSNERGEKVTKNKGRNFAAKNKATGNRNTVFTKQGGLGKEGGPELRWGRSPRKELGLKANEKMKQKK